MMRIALVRAGRSASAARRKQTPHPDRAHAETMAWICGKCAGGKIPLQHRTCPLRIRVVVAVINEDIPLH